MSESLYPKGNLIYENPLSCEADLKDFVLSRFHGEDLEAVRDSVKLAADAAVMMVEDGNAVRAMNRVNGAAK